MTPTRDTRDLHGSRHAPALLDQIADGAVDGDYLDVAAREERTGRSAHGTRLIALLLLGLLIATGLVQTARSEPAARQGRAQLLDQLDAGADALAERRTRLAELQRDLARLTTASSSLGLESLAVRTETSRASRLAAADGVEGPGLVVTVADAPDATSPRERVLDKDLQRLVNGLWAAGAQAIAVDGVRLTALSSIRTAGEAITVDYRSVRSPYEVSVLGDANAVQAGFLETTHGRYWFELAAAVGVTLDFAPRGKVELPAARRLGLRQAQPLDREDSGRPS